MQPNRYGVVSLTALVGLFLASATQRVGAQVAYDAPHSKAGHSVRVEVLGLRHWTLKALQDSIRHRVPGQTLEDAACMVTLLDSLHFADALVQSRVRPASAGEAEQEYLVIKVIEPQDSARVRWRPAPRDSFKVQRPDYASVVLPVTSWNGQLLSGRLNEPLQLYGRNPADRAAAIRGRPQIVHDDAERLWSFLDAHRSESNRYTAVAALRQDGPYVNRVVAAAVLANFAEQDSTWWALTEALRDGNEAVRLTALLVLQGLPARPIDWTPAIPTLRALLGGTNVLATQDVMDLLVRTHVSAAFARSLLHDNGDWVLTHLRAEYPWASDSAHSLLVQLNSGRDLGANPTDWARWIAAL
jgi:hypothetical protein